jgi:FkbM family methyltransferase
VSETRVKTATILPLKLNVVTKFLWGPQEPLIQKIPKPAFLMNDDDSGRCQMFKVGIPELALVNYAKSIARSNSTFIDGGAHMGVYSILLADNFEKVYAFEPQRRTYFQLCGNIFINEKDNIITNCAALTDKQQANDVRTLYIVSDDGGGSTLEKTTETVKRTEEVRTTAIDDYAIENVGLIKLDIEGSELAAIQGAENTLRNNAYPPIIFEANGHSWCKTTTEDLFRHLTSLNYQIAKIQPFDNMYLARQGEDLLR